MLQGEGGGGGGGGAVRAMSSGITKKMKQTMYLLFLGRSGHLETVASVSTSKCVPNLHLLIYMPQSSTNQNILIYENIRKYKKINI